MKDYNLRSHDIYGQPQRGRSRGWWKFWVVLLVVAASAAFFLLRDQAPSPDASVTPAATDPDVIPLVLPPPRISPTPAATP
jgi:hypothetical protein